MEEALDILWTYARREPIESNGKTIVATISQSIAAIRLIMRLEGWLQKGEKQNVKSEKQAAPAYTTTPTLTTSDLPAAQCLTSDLPMPACKGKAHDSEADEQFTQTNIDTQAPPSPSERGSGGEDRSGGENLHSFNHSSKPRKVCRQRPCVKDDKSPNHTSKPRKVCLQRSAAKEDLYKEITLIESPIRRASLNCVSNLTLAKALPP